jgi:hypothetical protein
MKEKSYQYALNNDDLVIVEIKIVGDPKYNEGVMFTFRCMSSSGETLFAIENSHGKPHMHLGKRKQEAPSGWEAALHKFSEMLREHKKKIGQR